jgi:lysine 2,3-aminomutase
LAGPSDWDSWTWQLQNSLKTLNQFDFFFREIGAPLTPEERDVFVGGASLFNIRTTPYYAALVKSQRDPLRRILMPHRHELAPEQAQQMDDPLGEKKNNPAPRIIHRYSDRVLFLVTDICSVYCRYCTRKHFTGQDQALAKREDYDQALEYIRKNLGIREVILSGGDPLTLGDSQLERILWDLRQISHIEIIRIGTRIPVVCPQRITLDLVKMVRKHKPVFLMTHFNHPRELTLQAAEALENFVDHGIPVMNQMVLLNGVNNHEAIVQALSRRLLYLRVKPYYMFQCDPSLGSDHLRTSLDESLKIQRLLWGHLSGLALPTLSVDIPLGGGKATLAPQFDKSRSSTKWDFEGWDGVKSEYVNPRPEHHCLPEDYEHYLPEWEKLRTAKE